MANTIRLPRAAETLRDQVRALKPRTKVERYGEPDGFNVVRSLVFNKATSTWLEPLLDVIEDPRISSTHTLDDGRLVVTFSHLPLADQTTEFPLEKVSDVLRES